MSKIKAYYVFSTTLAKGAIIFGRSDTYTDCVTCDPTKLFWDDTNNYLGIGTSSPIANLNVEGAVVFNNAGADYDVRMEGDTDTSLFFLDAGNDRIGIGTAAPGAKIDVRGSAIFNEDAGNNDFRIESQSQTHLFFLDASAGKIGINEASPARLLDVSGQLACTTIFGTSTTFIDGDTLYCGGGVGADNFFFDRDIAGGQFIIGYNTSKATGTGTPGILQVYDNATNRNTLFACKGNKISGGQMVVVVNENQADVDFRWETDANDNGILGDAGNANITINGASVSAYYDLGLVGDGILMLKETTTPTNDVNYGKIYTKNDDTLYFQDGAGVEHSLFDASSEVDHDATTNFVANEHIDWTNASANLSTSGNITTTGGNITCADANDIKFSSGAKIERSSGDLVLTPETSKLVLLASIIDGSYTNNVGIQCGQVTSAAVEGDTTVTFTRAFTATPRVAVAYTNGAADKASIQLNAPSTTGFTFRTYTNASGAYAASRKVDWIAIGPL